MTLWTRLFELIHKPAEPVDKMKKYLITGLGNPGDEYRNTRHNIGFDVLDALAERFEVTFSPSRLGATAKIRHKGRLLLLLKPSTYMNRSGKAVRYWLQKENIPVENLLVVSDDLSLPPGTLRMKGKGGAGGHNGLQDIQDILGTTQYARLRFGIGNDFPEGGQTGYVLGKWTEGEQALIRERIPVFADAVLSFATAGLQHTMNAFNGK